MPTISDTAVCIRQWDFSETSQTVQLFTRGHGMLRGLAKGARRERGSFSGGFDVLTRGHVVAIVKHGRDLATLTEWKLLATYRQVRGDLRANRAGLYMVDLLHHMLTDADPHPGLFDVFLRCLDTLVEPGRAGAALVRLQWAVLEETGYRPVLDRDAETGVALPEAPALAYSASAGGVVASVDGPDRYGVRRETIELLRAVARGESTEDVAPETIDRANRLLAVHCRAIIGRELPTVRWTFGELI